MKQHLIKTKKENKSASISHIIIFLVLITIFVNDFIKKYTSDTYNLLNLFINIFYYFLCVLKEINKKNSNKFYQQYFHFCFSISVSIIFLKLGFEYLENKDILQIKLLYFFIPFFANIIEAFVNKRNKPKYINLLYLVLFIFIYFFLIQCFVKIGINIDDVYDKHIHDYIFPFKFGLMSTLGAVIGWALYKLLTRKKAKKINLDSSIESNDISEE